MGHDLGFKLVFGFGPKLVGPFTTLGSMTYYVIATKQRHEKLSSSTKHENLKFLLARPQGKSLESSNFEMKHPKNNRPYRMPKLGKDMFWSFFFIFGHMFHPF